MVQEITSAYTPRQVGGGNGGGVSSVRPQEMQQNMRLVVDVGDGKIMEIPLKGHLPLHCYGSTLQAATPREEGSESSTVVRRAITLPAVNRRSDGAVGEGIHMSVRRGDGRGSQSGEECMVLAESQNAKAKYQNDMRGWIMTVATLFVGISFEAMNQRPDWMRDPREGLNLYLNHHHYNSTDPAIREARRVVGYVLFNTLTFSTSLVVVVILLLPNLSSPEATLRTVRKMMMVLAVIFAINFSFMISKDAVIMKLVFIVIAIHALLLLLFTLSSSDFRLLGSKLTRRRSLLPIRSGYGV